MLRFIFLLSLLLSLLVSLPVLADQRNDPIEQAMSDTLDLWRESSFDKLYDSLSHRNNMTRESFIDHMKYTALRPSCCHKKLSAFRVISSRKASSTVYASIGMEGGSTSSDTRTREFTLDHDAGEWKMRLADIKSLAGLSKTKKSRSGKSVKQYH